jgi:hypothetical protein
MEAAEDREKYEAPEAKDLDSGEATHAAASMAETDFDDVSDAE